MSLDQPKQSDTPPGNADKHPDNWTTGDEKMTGAQASYLKTLSEEAEAGPDDGFNPELSKAEASLRIDALRQHTGRGGEIAGGNPGQNPNPQEPNKKEQAEA
jgi:hypothetical protein